MSTFIKSCVQTNLNTDGTYVIVKKFSCQGYLPSVRNFQKILCGEMHSIFSVLKHISELSAFCLEISKRFYVGKCIPSSLY
jgi:hypothetical protein